MFRAVRAVGFLGRAVGSSSKPLLPRASCSGLPSWTQMRVAPCVRMFSSSPVAYSLAHKTQLHTAHEAHIAQDPQIFRHVDEQVGERVTIKAFHVARAIDIVRVYQNLYDYCPHMFHSKSVIVTVDEAQRQHVGIFKYGSVVFFNMGEDDMMSHLREIKKYSVVPIAEGLQHTEDYNLVVAPDLEAPSTLRPSYLMVQNLDKFNINVVGTVMAQTVALDHYGLRVDHMLETFVTLNTRIEQTGMFDAMEKKRLFKLVAANNSVVTDVLLKLGIFDKSDVAWKYADYTPAWEGLRKEFEVEHRFRNLEYKLNLISESTRFFLEILHNQQSGRLEWIIVYLISAEIFLSILDLLNIRLHVQWW